MIKRSGLLWIELIGGILLLILGIATFVRPEGAITGIVIIYGIFAVLTGIADITFYCRIERHTGIGSAISLITGILSVMAGIMLLAYPRAGEWVLSFLFPIWFIAHCISSLSHLNMVRMAFGNFYFYFSMILNVIGLILGFILIFDPMVSLLSLSLIIGSYLVLLGIDMIVISVGSMRNR